MSVDLKTTYLGIELDGPLVASSSPMTKDVESACRLEDHGASAVVLPSLFQEHVEHYELQVALLYEDVSESSGEALDWFPPVDVGGVGPDDYLELIRETKRRLDIPVIASLNGSSESGWESFARQMKEAGADALELNVYFIPTDAQVSGRDIERRYLELIEATVAAVDIPVAVKIGPYFSSLPNMARRMEDAGAKGLVIFNRYLQPHLDLQSLEVTPHLELSRSPEARLALQWIAILYGQVRASLAHSTGIHTAADAARALLVGADVTMLTSALLTHGPEHLDAVRTDLVAWMEENDYESVRQLRGSMSRMNSPDPAAFERANYMKALQSYTTPAD